MNLGNGDGWIPAMPEKAAVQRPNEGLLEMQRSEIREENWEELLGIYSGVLQEESCNKLPLECNHNSLAGVNQMGPTTSGFSPIERYNRVLQNSRPTGLVGMTCGEDHVQNVAFAETYNRLLPQSHRGDNVHHVDPVQMLFGSFNQSARSYVSYLQNTGSSAHRKVDSMSELLGTGSFNAPTMKEDRVACVIDKPSSIGPHSQVEGNWRNHGMDSMMHLKNQILHANQHVGGYNLQQIPASRLSVAYRPSYNLNLPARSMAGESSSVARPLQQGPVTPDQRKLQNNIFQVPHLAIDERLSEVNNKQDNAVLPQQVEIREREHNDYVYDSPGAISATISMEPKEKEKEKYDSKNDGEIDLNQTPPQKTPKRRKHRPKVVVEGKPKRTPKPKASENKTPGESSTKKRKYVQKKDIKTDQSSDVTNGIEVSNVESQAKSCKRALNFDLENGVGKKIKGGEFDYQADIEGSELNLNLDSHNAGQNGQSTPTVKDVCENINRKQKQTENPYNLIHSVESIPPHQELLPVAVTAPPTPSKGHTLNVIARNMNVRNVNINQSGGQTKNGHVHHDIGGGLALILANTSRQNLNGKGEPKLQNRPQLLQDFMNASEKQGSKREYSHTELTRSLMVSQIWSHGVSETSHYNRESRKLWHNGLESSMTKNVKDKINEYPSSMPSGNRTAGDCSEQIESTGNKRFPADSSKLQVNGGLTYFGSKGRSTFIDLTNETNMIVYPGCINSTDPGHEFQKQVSSYAEQMAHMAPQHFAKSQSSSSLTAAANCHMVIASQRDSQITKGNKTIDDHARVTIKRQTTRQTPSKSRMDKVLQKETKYLQGYGHDSKKVAGSREYKRNIFSIDDITDRMKDLHIGNNSKEIVQEEQNALVPYRGDGAVVPFEVFDPIKKRKPRPKVDLDPETNRLWNLLMGQEGSAEPMDNGKQKYWEEERKVFSGRVDSFIARMHLVQGDRRFSKWKGSVVDSVIGVFLTQNVSDHLSSSAFMSLAAKFPLKSTTIRETCSQSRGNPSTEHKVNTSYPDERTSSRYLLTREPVIEHSSVISSPMSQYKAENVTSGKNYLINNHSGRIEECMISSQSCSESLSCQASEDIRSSSGSNSEPEDQVTRSSFRKNGDPLNLYEQDGIIAAFQQYQVRETESPFPDNRSSNDDQQSKNLVQSQNPEVASIKNKYSYPYTSSLLHHQRTVSSAPNSWQKMVMGMEEVEIDPLEFVGTDCVSSLSSTHFDTTIGTCIEHAHHNSGQSAESSLTEVIKKHPEQQMNLPTEFQSRNGKHFINFSEGGMQETFQREKTFPKDPIKFAETFSQKPSDNQKPSENITLKPNEAKTSKIPDVQSSKISTTSNARKQKVEKEKAEAFNWDTLRKQVQSKAGTKGRSRDKMDSLDYDAIRNADVHEISNTIKERGMNNMLAERMKDFLNRLVKDHGGIDLEWLRDVQPDKAKDYLLSIRGLGLKSVECVRLLTLHHLAFPVDTNVGRIAVRLGWVPLQPLPETLQLHLLELYPVLESIQKYLWPRLCMLDQETLYELHYQLITFGKVFCTKRQPNCNACPMRGECRHFASAFASARLALPGPEERRIACSDVQTSSNKSCGVAIHPMLLPPAEDSLVRGPEITRNCEPIIEEPTTPDSSIEVSERDIEDAFYEDPDEIPEIKLNIEEFTSNLQSFIQEKMDCQEGDMTKALVALSPGFASIPMPKLKHVSRLRTEHQVYELPDSHPLLKGLDRREPDDPSPYLLAIWTPGETADSVEPPESKCSASIGGLCNTKTCFSCNCTREAQAQTVRGTILIPCRTAMRGSFPLNGTYFQVNEVFADDETSTNPLDVPRSLIWNLPRRTVFFGTSVSTIFKGMSTEDIQYCFWKGFVCVRGFDQKNRAPRPLKARLHLAASKIAKRNE